MKSLKVVKLLVICFMITMVMNLKTKTKKSESVLEFFNNMFSEGQLNKYNMKNTTESPAANKPPASPSQDSNSTDTGILADWLQISSPSFKVAIKYPPVVMPDGSEIEIRVDNDNYRLNDAIRANDVNGPKDERDFWFRLSGNHIYYAMTKTDMNVIGAIAVDQIRKAQENQDHTQFCFLIDDAEHSRWTLCANSRDLRTKWVCAIKKALGQNPTKCNPIKPENKSKTIIEHKVIQPIIIVPLPSQKCNTGWNYVNHGSDWACTCQEGLEQSPIDLPKPAKALSSPVAPLFHYEEVEAKSPITSLDGQVISEQYIKLKYFENSLRIFHPNMGKIVTLDGAVYIAEEIVFHTPSEHTIDGKRYDMEMQIIHYGQTNGDIAKQVVLSFLFQKKPGVYNKFMDDVDFFALPNPMFKERDITNNLYIPKIFYSSTDNNIPTMKPFSFFTYQGSVTFPPCTERTIHYVASQPIPIASAPLELMRESLRNPNLRDSKGNMLIDNAEYKNYRQTQPLNNRAVFYYDHKKFCGPDLLEKKIKPAGHYEKVPKKVTQYYYVNNNEPSGLPGSYVVDELEAKNVHLK